MNKPVIVLGNGSSLKNFDFKNNLKNIDTIGTCAAYRHWYDINWFPTHYVNADNVVVRSHGKHIKDMIINKKCSTFLLRKKFLKYWPECINYNYVFFLEDLLKTSDIFKLLIRRFGTGTIATAYGIHLKYSEIRLLGIDCDYVEFIPESKKLPNNTLIITETPKFNPNYFIDNYQQKGDKYCIPGCEQIHLKSWKHLSKLQKKIRNQFNCKIINYNYKKTLSSLFTTIEDINLVYK